MAGNKVDFPFRALIMEALGVMFLCFFGGLSCIMEANNKGTLVSVAVCHFFILAGLIYVGAATSGGHYNPAVSLGCLITGKQFWWHSVLYIIFQCVGSILGGLLLRFCVPIEYRAVGGLGFPSVGGQATNLKALGVEIIGTFSLVFMVFALAVDKRATKLVYAMCIGGSLGAAVLAFGKVSGAALNPARWFGPCLFGVILNNCKVENNGLSTADQDKCDKQVSPLKLAEFWIYLAGPFGGGLAAAVLYRFLFLFDQPADDDKKNN